MIKDGNGSKLEESEIRPDELINGQEERYARDARRLLKHKNDFLTVACPACDGDEYRIYGQRHGIQFVICRTCETVYANPRPAPEHLEEHYRESEDYAFWNKYVFPASEAARREKIFKPRVRKVIDICQRFDIRTNTLLEVGAGFGIFCEEIQKTGMFKRVIGLEPTPDLAQSCRGRGVEVIEKTIEQVVFEDEKIDVITNFEVIEHLFSPRDFLIRCRNLLSNGGFFILTCPNVKGFDVVTLAEESGVFDLGHINLFHLDSLAGLLEDCGFEVIEKQTPGRLDAELVRKRILNKAFDIRHQPFLKQVLIDEWETKGEAFQRFLSENLLSSNMLLVARRV